MEKECVERVWNALRSGDGELLSQEISRACPGALAGEGHELSRILFKCLVDGKIMEAKALLEAGVAGRFLEDGSTLVERLAEMGLVECVELLVAAGHDLNARSSFGRTALMSAAFQMRKEMVEFLLSAGADPTARDVNGMTAGDIARHSAAKHESDSLWAAMGNSIAGILTKSEVEKGLSGGSAGAAPRKRSAKV